MTFVERHNLSSLVCNYNDGSITITRKQVFGRGVVCWVTKSATEIWWKATWSVTKSFINPLWKLHTLKNVLKCIKFGTIWDQVNATKKNYFYSTCVNIGHINELKLKKIWKITLRGTLYLSGFKILKIIINFETNRALQTFYRWFYELYIHLSSYEVIFLG